MDILSIILLIVILAAFAAAVRYIWRNKGGCGGCNGDCASCKHGGSFRKAKSKQNARRVAVFRSRNRWLRN